MENHTYHYHNASADNKLNKICCGVIIMKNKLMSMMLIILLMPCILFTTGFGVCSVCITDESGTVLKNYYSGRNITNALAYALLFTKSNADENNLLTVHITKGSFSVSHTLYLTSYTTIDLGGARLVNANKKRGNIFKTPEDKEYPLFSSINECVIKNGTLDGNYNQNKSCILRLCHSQNVVIEDVEFLNNYYSHHCELAACNNVTFRNCRFAGQISDLNVSSSEAVQIDILDKVHFYGFTSYDNTMNNNINITDCEFRNVYRGVGTHNYFRDMYQTGITITGCRFENITDCAISSVNYKDVLYKDNRYINCKYSVFFRNNDIDTC